MRRGKRLNQQTIAALVVAGVLLVAGVLILGDSAGLFGTAADTPTPEAQVLDSDGDGINDPDDACPSDANHDAVGDPCNHDEDGDGVDDATDACPTESGTANGCPDSDGDGIANASDQCPDDANHDSVGDPCNHDEDGDGVEDTADACPSESGTLNGCPDSDSDGIANADDACPDDANHDSVGDPCNHDEDGDGVEDTADTCPNDAAPGTADGCVAVAQVTDTDSDGIPDDEDTCPDDANHDEVGDPCNHDEDGDGVNDTVDACPTDAAPDTADGCVAVAQVTDTDSDGIPDDEDACPDDANHDEVGDPCNHDEDGDGVEDNADACPSEAGTAAADGCAEAVVTDTDSDGTPDSTDVCPNDANHDTVGDPCNHDEDNDTFPDATDACPTVAGGTGSRNGCPPGGGINGGPNTANANVVTANFEPFTNPDGSVHFIDRSTGPVTSWAWSFGNGVTSTQQSPTYFYPNAGQFTVRLTVSNSQGQTSSAQAVVTVTEAQAAPSACNFTSAVQNTGLPASVLFTNTSSNVASYAWNFGNGQTRTTAGPHTISYGTPGNYNVTLTCTTSGGTTLNASGTVRITETGGQQPLIASFIANPTRGEAPLSVTFTDNSISEASDPITTWAWNFGSGQTATGRGPHTITFQQGSHSVSLTVTTQSGATATTGGNIEAIVADNQPAPGITVTPGIQGDVPFAVTINGTNSGGPITTWSWNFGNGQTATGQGPHNVTYSTPGTYLVTLNVDGPGGSGYAQQSIVATTPGAIVEAIFSYTYTGPFNNGQEVCFTNQSTGSIATYNWNFGDGSPASTNPNPCHTYATVGNYTVTLSVVGTNVEETSSSQRIVPIVSGNQAPVAAFTVDRTSANVGQQIRTTNQSTGIITSYAWTFGDGGTSTQQNPTHTYTTAGTYVIELTVTGPGGSSQAAQTSITVTYPTIGCTISGSSTANFFDTKTYTVTLTGLGSRVPTYNWVLTGPNGISVTGTTESFRHQFTVAGNYSLNVEISIDGVISCTATKAITVNTDTVTCDYTGDLTPRLQQTETYTESVGGLNGRTITTRTWTLNGTQVSTANNYRTTWTTAGTFTLVYSITLSDGTPCSVSKQIVVSNSTLECSISGNDTVYFYETRNYTASVSGPSGTRTYAWTVNGTPAGGNSSTLSYQFTTVGATTYNITVTVTVGSDNCTVTKVVTVRNSGADGIVCDYSGDTSPLLNQSVNYDGTYDRAYGRPLAFAWAVINRDTGATVASGTSEDFSYQWATAGRFRLTFTVTPTPGSPCTRTRDITVSSSAVICNIDGPDSVRIYQSRAWTATGDSGNPTGLTTRWTVDGVQQSGSSNTLNFAFTSTGSHTILLEYLLNGTVACSKTKTVTVQIDNLTCTFDGVLNPLLLSTQNYTSSTQNLNGRTATYEWRVDGTSVGTSQNLSYQWTTSGAHEVRLVVTPSQGNPCEIVRTVTVRSESLLCSINGELSPYSDAPYTYTSSVQGLGNLTATYVWSLDGIQVSTSQNLNYEFDAAGSATLTLAVTTTNEAVSCTATAQLTIRAGQSINAIATPNSGIAPLNVTFTAETENIDRSTLTWRYPGGGTHRSEISTFLFDQPGQYTVRVTGEGPLGTEEATVVVNVGTESVIRAAFTPRPFNGLVGTEICFIDGSQGEEIISWAWDLDGDGTDDVTNDTNASPCRTYNAEGNYRVHLTVRNRFGLQAEATNIVRIFAAGGTSGSIGIDIQAAGLVCFTSILQTGDQVVEWNFGDGSPPSTEANPCHTYVPGTYTVALTAQGENVYTIVRTITVTLIPANELPELDLVGLCVEPGGNVEPFARFTISNTGGNMTQPDHYQVIDGEGNVVDQADFSLDADENLVLEYPNRTGLTLTTRDSQLTTSVNPCFAPPNLSATGICTENDGTVSFTLTNNGGPMPEGIPYTITSGATTLDSGTTTALGAGESQTFTVDALPTGATVDFSAGENDDVTASVENCYQLPDLSATGVCTESDGAVSFTLTNNGGPMSAGIPYTITSGTTTLDSGTTNALDAGESQTFTVDALPTGATVDFSAGRGEVTASVENCYALPDLSATGVCNENDGTVSFTLVNNGGPMSAGVPYTIVSDTTTLASGTTNALAAGESQSFTVDALDSGATIDFSTDDEQATASVENCYALPDLSATGICNENDGTVSFTLVNNGGPMSDGVEYTITSGATTLDSGTTNALAAGESQTFTVDALDSGATIDFSANDGEATASVENCYALPELSATGVCNEDDGTVSFTLTNSGGPMNAGVPYTITSDTTTLESGTTNALTAGESQTFTVNALDSGATIDFSADNATATASVENCYALPSLDAAGICNNDGTLTFTLVNNGGPMSAGIDYTIGTADEVDGIESGTTNALAAGESQTFTVDAPVDDVAVLFSAGNQALGATASTENCLALPALEAAGVCNGDGTLTFTLTNTGGPMPTGLPYSIVFTANGGGELEIGTTQSLAAGESQSFTIPAPIFATPIIFTVGDATLGATADTENCLALPELAASGICNGNGTATFIITNNGGPMDAGLPYDISAGDETLDSGTTDALGAGVSQTFTVDVGTSADAIDFTVGDGTLGASASLEDCRVAPSLLASGVCNGDGTVTFTLTNTGSPLLNGLPYTISIDGTVVDSGTTSSLGEGGSQTFTVDAPPDGVTVDFSAGDGQVTASMENCLSTPVCAAITYDEYGFPIIDMRPEACNDQPVPRGPWTEINVGVGICPDWLLYHTDQTSLEGEIDWEVFRLGGNDLFPESDVNLTQGEGNRVFDIAPSRSPDAQWITFASTRDGNWEIYVAPVDNSPNSPYITQRVTYNTTAIDIDPVWSPGASYDAGSLLVYESARDGQWDLYVLDVRTGVEERLTDDPGNDLNAFWSPDGTKIAYQSDREGFWQIYVVDLLARDEDGMPVETRLSDGLGDDHDPIFSNEGDRIVFRSYRDGDTSVIYVMDADGGNVTRISDPAADATNHTWSPDDTLIAYQSNLDGDLDVYVYEFESEQTRLVTDNEGIRDYAPTWLCNSTTIVFSSDVDGNPNIFNTPALPIDAEPIIVDEEASRMTDEPDIDYYPENSPSEENASRQGQLPTAPKNR